MMYNRTKPVRSWLWMAFIVSSLTLGSCSSKKAENAETNMADTTTASDSSVFGRQGDTINNTQNAPQQAPVDSVDLGAVAPIDVKVTPKK